MKKRNTTTTFINPSLIGSKPTQPKVHSPLDNVDYGNTTETPVSGKAKIYLGKKIIGTGELISQITASFFNVKVEGIVAKYSTRHMGSEVPRLVIA